MKLTTNPSRTLCELFCVLDARGLLNRGDGLLIGLKIQSLLRAVVRSTRKRRRAG